MIYFQAKLKRRQAPVTVHVLATAATGSDYRRVSATGSDYRRVSATGSDYRCVSGTGMSPAAKAEPMYAVPFSDSEDQKKDPIAVAQRKADEGVITQEELDHIVLTHRMSTRG